MATRERGSWGGAEEESLDEATIKRYIQELTLEIQLETIKGNTADFIKSLAGYYKAWGRLSPKQQFYLKKSYLRAFPDHLPKEEDDDE